MKIIKEGIDNLKASEQVVTSLTPTEAEAVEADKQKQEDVAEITDPMLLKAKEAFLGAEKQPEPDEVEEAEPLTEGILDTPEERVFQLSLDITAPTTVNFDEVVDNIADVLYQDGITIEGWNQEYSWSMGEYGLTEGLEDPGCAAMVYDEAKEYFESKGLQLPRDAYNLILSINHIPNPMDDNDDEDEVFDEGLVPETPLYKRAEAIVDELTDMVDSDDFQINAVEEGHIDMDDLESISNTADALLFLAQALGAEEY